LPLVLIIWLFSKYSPAEIIVRVQISVMAMLGICYGVIVYSGKRMHLALALVIPFIAALIRRQYGAVMLFGGGGAIALALLVVGQGNFFVLPLSAQRAMSFIPGMKVDAVIEDQSQTNFRTTLRQISLEKIAQHPIIGNGLSVSEGEIIELEAMQEYAVEETDSHAYKMAAGSAWHNTWLGISTDFGIPCAVVFAVFWFSNFQVLCSSSTKVADRELCLYFGNDAVDHEYRGFAPVMGRWSQSGRCFVGEGGGSLLCCGP